MLGTWRENAQPQGLLCPFTTIRP